jgi:hypothetical protein
MLSNVLLDKGELQLSPSTVALCFGTSGGTHGHAARIAFLGSREATKLKMSALSVSRWAVPKAARVDLFRTAAKGRRV